MRVRVRGSGTCVCERGVSTGDKETENEQKIQKKRGRETEGDTGWDDRGESTPQGGRMSNKII